MYGIIKLLLKKECAQDIVLIESPFTEETRLGAYCDKVILAITPNNFIIASKNKVELNKEQSIEDDSNIDNFTLRFIYPLNSIKIAVFKRTRRQMLKVVSDNLFTRYFELGRMPGRKIFWRLWCCHVKEIIMNSSRWPYAKIKRPAPNMNNRWTDKHLYLGSKRYTEDQIRPMPIPGIGRTEDKLSYLKPQHCGYCDDSGRLVQCHDEIQANTHSYEDITYTDDPNSNITYTSLVTTVGIIGQF